MPTKEKDPNMMDFIALGIVRRNDLAGSALPDAPIVPPETPTTPLRNRVLAAVLRRTAERERRWADRLDPVVHRPTVLRSAGYR